MAAILKKKVGEKLAVTIHILRAKNHTRIGTTAKSEFASQISVILVASLKNKLDERITLGKLMLFVKKPNIR